nr:hypothetical protein CFP56_36320 [Quercus suber]
MVVGSGLHRAQQQSKDPDAWRKGRVETHVVVFAIAVGIGRAQHSVQHKARSAMYRSRRSPFIRKARLSAFSANQIKDEKTGLHRLDLEG